MADDTRLEEAYLLLNYSRQNQIETPLSPSVFHSRHQLPEPPKKHLKLVAIHLGAGNGHNEAQSLDLAKRICQEVMLQSRSESASSGTSNLQTTHQDSSSCPNDCKCQEASICGDNYDEEWAAVELVRKMEDHQMLNCGFGSNLNIHGQVECDASFMSDKTQMWAGVGAVSGCKNPILLAKSLYNHRVIPRPLGLIQPNLLVASGAKQWMRKHCPSLAIADSKLVSSKAFSHYQRLKSSHDIEVRLQLPNNNDQKLCLKTEHTLLVGTNGTLVEQKYETTEQSDSRGTHSPTNRTSTSSTSFDHGFYCMTGESSSIINSTEKNTSSSYLYEEDDISNINSQFGARLDTVGAVVVGSDNSFVSAISSGGLLLKYKGRVGQAAIPGAGCWSEDSVAATATGVGEYLTLNLFARKFYDKMLTLRMLYDLGHVDKKPDLSHLISCGVHECFRDLSTCPGLAHVLPQDRLAGILSVCTLNSKECPQRIDENDLYLSYGHNTPSMCIGFMTSDDEVAHSVMSRYRSGEKDTRACVKTIKLSLKTSNAFNSYQLDNDNCSS